MDLIISNASGKPIYEQITNQVKEQIMGCPALHPGAGQGSAHQRHHHHAGL